VTVETLIMAQLELAQKDPSQAFRAAGAVKLLSLAAAGLERLHNLKWTVLGMNRDSLVSDDLPILIFQDLTEQEIKEIQQGHDEDDLDDPAPTEPEAGIEAVQEHDLWDDEEDEVIIEGEGSVVTKPAPLTTADGWRYVRDAVVVPNGQALS
jgi:hypothetical protein